MPMLNMRYVLPDHVIDLNKIEALSYLREEGGALHVGAMTRQRDLEFSDAVAKRFPIIREAILMSAIARRAIAARSAVRSVTWIRPPKFRPSRLRSMRRSRSRATRAIAILRWQISLPII